MLAFVGFIMAAQVTGKGPIANLVEHIADPLSTSIFSKALILPGASVKPACAIPPITQFQARLSFEAPPHSPHGALRGGVGARRRGTSACARAAAAGH